MVCDFVCVKYIYIVVCFGKKTKKGKKEGKKMSRSLWERVLCCAVRIVLGRFVLHWLIDLFFSKTIRFVMQDHIDPRSFTIVERYAHESSQKYVLSSLLRLLLFFFFTFATREF